MATLNEFVSQLMVSFVMNRLVIRLLVPQWSLALVIYDLLGTLFVPIKTAVFQVINL